MPDQLRPRVVLCILDGVGYREDAQRERGNAVIAAHPSYYESLFTTYPHTSLDACGLAVGLPAGQMGNSEVGHLTIGAGRILYQELVRITRSMESGEFAQRPQWRDFARQGLEGSGRLHLIGLVSDGGVHSHQDHLVAIVAQAAREGFREIFLHVLLDGRDTDPRSGLGFLEDVMSRLAKIGAGRVATVMGRYWGMDRDQRWERTARAWNAIVEGDAATGHDPLAVIRGSYDGEVTDEFVEPTVMVDESGEPVARVQDGDSIFFWNFRADRARQLTWAFMSPGFEGWPLARRPRVNYLTMTPYDEKLTEVPALYHPVAPTHGLAQTFADHGIRNLRAAETEKYAHVTYFFNGGREEPYPGEDRRMVPSPKIATYDLQPEMSAPAVAALVREACEAGEHDVIVVNFANGDMVGHTGVFEAAVKAIGTLDRLLAEIMPPSLANGTVWLVTADHGNCDEMLDPEGHVLTQHSLNPVPFVIAGREYAGISTLIAPGDHGLADIAPTILQLLGLPQPEEMTGRSILRTE
jgi:2,3-bisphosphoglycerate-independent phosphoglycerate mutase